MGAMPDELHLNPGFPLLPFLITAAFYLIAEIDSPRYGVIHVVPENLVSLSQSLQTR
jgi:hypothetical protein